MPKRRKILLLIAAAIIVPLTLYLCRDTTSDEARNRTWIRTKNWAYRFHTAESSWPASLASFIGQLHSKYDKKAEALEKDLYESGYLVHVRINVIVTTNVSDVVQMAASLSKVLPPAGEGAYILNGGDHQILICRAKDEALCRNALKDKWPLEPPANSDIARPSTPK